MKNAKNLIIILLTLVFVIFMIPEISSAQCAMCRATIEANIAEREDLASGLNLGILYLAIFPYLLIGGVAYFWYRTSRKNYEKAYKIRSNY